MFYGKVFFNPAKRANKYANELKYGWEMTNDLAPKLDSNNAMIDLTATQKAFRSGYLQARKDNAEVFKAKMRRK